MAKRASTKLKKNNIIYKSPSNSRFIPEVGILKNPFYLKVTIISFISGFLLMAISMKGYQLISQVNALHSVQAQRSELTAQLSYWKEISQKHAGYRDAYFKIAVIAYQLGDKKQAKEALIEALALDPNFKEGRAFGEKTGLL